MPTTTISCHNRENFRQAILNAIIYKTKTFWSNFHCVSEIFIISEHIEKTDELKHFWNYWVRNTWLLRCLNGPVSEHPSTINLLTGPKNSWKLHGSSTFILLFHHYEIHSARSHLSYSDLKSWDYLFTHWLSTASILFITGRFSSSQFKCNHLSSNLNCVSEIYIKFWKF